MQTEPRPQLAFVIKFWLEPSSAGESQWRGVVQSLDDNKRRYFADLSDAVTYLASCMKAAER